LNSNSKNPAKTRKTHFHKFSMNPTTKKYRHPYRLYMWTPWKVSTFLAWEEEDYSLKTLAPLSKASGSNPADVIPRSSRLPAVVDWGKMDGRDCTKEEGEEDCGEGEKLKWPSSKETKFDWKKRKRRLLLLILALQFHLFFLFFFLQPHSHSSS